VVIAIHPKREITVRNFVRDNAGQDTIGGNLNQMRPSLLPFGVAVLVRARKVLDQTTSHRHIEKLNPATYSKDW